MKVSLYIHNYSTRKYERAEPKTIYPLGTIFVLRFGSTWETLKDCTNYAEAKVAALRKEIDLITGAVDKPAPRPKPTKDACARRAH